MKTETLERHISETIKEWQMKIGYRNEEMSLYYPDQSLIELLELQMEEKEADLYLMENLKVFVNVVKSRFGEIRITNKGERYCLTIPMQGCEYIHTNYPEPVFLKEFLRVVTGNGASLQKIRACFEQAAVLYGEEYTELDWEKEGMGHVFYFGKREEIGGEHSCSQLDESVYCVEADEFGVTYHRFTWYDFQKLARK